MIEKVNFKVSDEEIEITRDDVLKEIYKGTVPLDDAEIDGFLRLCKFQKLNPFLGDVYIIKDYGYVAQYPTTKEFMLKRAQKNPKYKGYEAGITLLRNGQQFDCPGYIKAIPSDILLGGWAKVYVDGYVKPVYINVPLSLYSGMNGLWSKTPELMIRKVSLVQALREAFPQDFNKLYDKDEMMFKEKEHNHVQNMQQSNVQQMKPQQVKKNSTDGVAGNPNSIPQIENKVVDIKSALNHIGLNGMYAQKSFGQMLNTDPEALNVFQFYANTFNDEDGDCARAILVAISKGILRKK